MKGRPRRVEREVAKYMSKFYQFIDMSEVERIPVLGRTGPDIDVNEMKLAIDVKSRKSVPKGVQVKDNEIVSDGDWYGCRLDQIHNLLMPELIFRREVKPSKMVTDWLDHMDEWTQTNEEADISGLVLHRTGSNIGNALFLIRQLEVFYDRASSSYRRAAG